MSKRNLLFIAVIALNIMLIGYMDNIIAYFSEPTYTIVRLKDCATPECELEGLLDRDPRTMNFTLTQDDGAMVIFKDFSLITVPRDKQPKY
jgi:hypothetical protein